MIRKLAIFILAIAVVTILLALWGHPLQHWAAVHTGTVNEQGPYYGFFSGFGSDLTEATILVTVISTAIAAYRKINCHTAGCPWIGHHKVEGTPYVVCKSHLRKLHLLGGHPDPPDKNPTIEQIHAEHQRRIIR